MSTTSTPAAQHEPAPAQGVRVRDAVESAQPSMHATKPAPTMPTVTERRTAFHTLMSTAMTAVKRIDAASRTGDATSAQRAYEALLEAERMLRRAAR